MKQNEDETNGMNFTKKIINEQIETEQHKIQTK